MISVNQAKRLILQSAQPLPPQKMALREALGLVLAQEVKSPSDYPLYDVSAMDGYALRNVDVRAASKARPVTLKIRGTQNAGVSLKVRLKSGECLKVMTGGVIPKDCDALLEREQVMERKGKALVSQPVAKGRNIRFQGEGIKQGASALKTGTLLHSRAIGFLASLGVAEVQVRPRPRVSLLVTGNELVRPGQKHRPGQIYNSNQWMLESALREKGVNPALNILVPDRPQKLKAAVKRSLASSDILLLAGGVSVGDLDFSKPILESLGVKRVFWRVSQKPGFPLYFGRKGRALVFGLPGNPASAWINFHEYVAPALAALQGKPFLPPRLMAILESKDIRRGWKTLFLKSFTRRHKGRASTKVLEGQASHLLKSLAEGNSLIVIPPGKTKLRKGSTVEVHPLPGEKA